MTPRDPGAGHAAGFGYHATLVGDPHRIAAYDLALRRALNAGATVLDVGTGTGILATLAARYGAGHVYAVESMAIAEVAENVFIANDVDARVSLIRSDIRSLAALDHARDVDVDLIVSDCLGRFVVDDFMGEAMAAAMRWLKPGGMVIPASVTLFAAPVELHAFAPLDGWANPVLGVDLTVVGTAAVHRALAVSVGPEALLAPGRAVGRWRPGEVLPAFEMIAEPWIARRAGRLRGFVGWFEADLGHGVSLSTAPGIGTHWQQLLFPTHAHRVDAGSALRFQPAVRFDGSPEPAWTWHVGIDAQPVVTYGQDAPRTARQTPVRRIMAAVSAESASEEGAAHVENGRFEAALAAFETALALAHSGEGAMPDATWLQRLREDVGVVATLAGRPERAVLPLIAALDGWLFGGDPPRSDDPHAEQSLRLLVDACMRTGRTLDGQRFLRLYNDFFGPHPAGWTPVDAVASETSRSSPVVEESF